MVDEVLDVDVTPSPNPTTEEDEAQGRRGNLGLHWNEVLTLGLGVANAHVRDGRQGCELEGDLDGVAGARDGVGGGGVIADCVAALLVEENPGGGGIDGAGMEVGGVEPSLHLHGMQSAARRSGENDPEEH